MKFSTDSNENISFKLNRSIQCYRERVERKNTIIGLKTIANFDGIEYKVRKLFNEYRLYDINVRLL